MLDNTNGQRAGESVQGPKSKNQSKYERLHQIESTWGVDPSDAPVTLHQCTPPTLAAALSSSSSLISLGMSATEQLKGCPKAMLPCCGYCIPARSLHGRLWDIWRAQWVFHNPCASCISPSCLCNHGIRQSDKQVLPQMTQCPLLQRQTRSVSNKTHVAFRLLVRATWCVVLALQSNVTDVYTMHSEMRFITGTGTMSGNNSRKAHSQACFKGLSAISSPALVKCFYLYADQSWLEQTHCQHTPKISPESRQCLSSTPLQSPNLLLLRSEPGVGAFCVCLCQSQVSPLLHGWHLYVCFERAQRHLENGHPVDLCINE